MTAVTPRLTSGVANTASSLAMTISQLSTISVPPPYAPPFTAAIMGLHHDCLREMEPKPFLCSSTSLLSLSGVFSELARLFHLYVVRSAGEEDARVCTNAMRSAPAQKSRPSPVMIETLCGRVNVAQSGEHRAYAPDARFRLDPSQDLVNASVHLRRHGIQGLRPIQCEEEDMLRRKRDLDLIGVLGDFVLHLDRRRTSPKTRRRT